MPRIVDRVVALLRAVIVQYGAQRRRRLITASQIKVVVAKRGAALGPRVKAFVVVVVMLD